MTNVFIGSSQSVVRKLYLTDGANASFPAGAQQLYAEPVVDSDGVEILEVWLLVPLVAEPDLEETTSKSGKVIYTNSVVYEEDEDAAAFAREIEESVAEGLDGFKGYDYDDS